MKRTNLFALTGILICFGGCLAISQEIDLRNPSGASPAPFAKYAEAARQLADTTGTLKLTGGPYLQHPAEDAVTVVWRTNRPCVSRVEYGPDLAQTAFNSRHGLIDAYTTLHRVRVTGLKPGATVPYRIVSTEIEDFKPYKVAYGETASAGPFEFTTLDAEKTSFSFIVLNDRHEKVPDLEKALGSVRWDGVDLVFLNGDMLDHAEDEEQVFASVIDPCVAAFAKRVPFLYVRGNHETRGRFARQLGSYFPSEGDRFYYSFNQGPVHFIVLDGGEDKADSDKEYFGLVDFDRYRTMQAEWLRRDIASDGFRHALYRVVLIHIPLGGGSNPGSADIDKKFGPILHKAGVDLMLSGHTHQYKVRAPDRDHDYPILVNGTNMIVRVDVSDDGLKPAVLKDDGTMADEQNVTVYWDTAKRRLARAERRLERRVSRAFR